MRKFYFFISVAIIIAGCKPDSYSQVNIQLVEVASGFTKPVDITNAGDSRLFIVEQAGRIEIISNGSVLSTPFLDIQSRVKSTNSEQGLLGLAFHPDYSTNGYFFVNYTGPGDTTHISRFKVTADANVADPASEVRVISIPQPYTNHNGGCVKFGPDGFLYIGMGDGGSGGDPQNRAQDSTELLGKMLRIDVDNLPYTIPSSNPFAGVSGIEPEIWALGVRNPWRFSFDKNTGDLWIADVGQNSWEEVDFQPANSTGGENYGWRCYEGFASYSPGGCLSLTAYVSPVAVYSNTGFVGDCSITGGYVYRGNEFPSLQGRYFYADYCSDKIWSVRDSSGTWVNEFHGIFATNKFSTFGQGNDGSIYIAGLQSGKILKITDSTAVTGIIKSGFVSPSVFPNPFNEEITIDLGDKLSLANLNVMNNHGAVVLSRLISSGRERVDLGFLSAGLYLISVECDGEFFTERIVKE